MIQYFQNLSNAIGTNWNRFWFTPRGSQELSILRIIVGLFALQHWTLMGLEFPRWFAADGLIPYKSLLTLIKPSAEQTVYRLSIFYWLPDDPNVLRFIWVLGIVLIAAFVAGFATRITSIATTVLILSIVHRVPMVTGLFEPVLTMSLLYLCLAPCGEHFSIQSRRRTGFNDSPQPSVLANIALRLLQIHVIFFYVVVGLGMLRGDSWWDGNAIWVLIASTDTRFLDLSSIASSDYALNAWNYFVLLYTVAFPLLIAPRVSRPAVVAVAALLWLSVGVLSGLWPYALLMASLSLVFFRIDDWKKLNSESINFERSAAIDG